MRKEENKAMTQRVLSAAGKMSSVMGIGFIVNLIGGLLIARLLLPEALGVWRLVQLGLQYAHFLNLGASHGLDRVGTTLVSRKQYKRYRMLMGAGLGFSLLLPVVVGCLLVLLLPFFPDPGTRLAVLSLIVLIPVQQFIIFSDLSLLFEKKFGTRALALFGYTVLRVLLSLVLAWYFGIGGALVSLVVTMVGYLAYMMSRSDMGLQLSVHGPYSWRIIKVGLPITLLALGEMVVQTIDKWLVFLLMGSEGMGFYTMAVFPLPLLMLLSSSLRDALTVEIYDSARQHGNAEGVRALFSQTLQLVALGSPVLMGAVFFGVPWIITWLLPHYITSIPAVEVHAIVSYPLMVSQTGLGIIVATKLEFRVFLFTALLALLSVGGTLVASSREDFSLTTILWVHSVIWFLYGGGLLWINHVKLGLGVAQAGARSFVYLLPTLVVGLELYAVKALIGRTGLTPYTFAFGATAGLLHLVACAPGLYYLERRYGSVSHFMGAVTRKLGFGGSA
jgi:O-antigen/teichoic acid export membrane protein